MTKCIALIAASCGIILSGCHVPLQSYRLHPFHPVIEVPPSSESEAFQPPSPTVKDCVGTDEPICLAFIEIDDMGEPFDKVELDSALSLIRRTNEAAKADPGKSDPIVITFVHGWKNNAGLTNDNVQGFKAALQAVYKQFKPSHHVIGIYIGWRGDLVRSYLPVARQFSYFNREATAIRVPGSTLSSAMTQIAARTHENPRALAVFIGHSFGGLLLERVLSASTASQISEASIFAQEADAAAQDPAAEQEGRLAARLAVNSRADLVIFINPAGAASEAKQMLDFLTYNRFRYQPDADPDAAAPGGGDLDRPLFVSLTSTADLATKVALPIGHALPEIGFKSKGSFRDLNQDPATKYELDCFDPHQAPSRWALKTKEEGAQPQSAYYMSTAPHMQVLQSHVMLKAVGASEMRVASTGETIHIADPRAIAECRPELFDKKLNIVRTFRLFDTHACFAIQERPNRCNGTPYWMMEIDPDVVPDHSTIFTQRFISFLIDTFFSTPDGKPMQRLHPQLMKSQ